MLDVPIISKLRVLATYEDVHSSQDLSQTSPIVSRPITRISFKNTGWEQA